MMNPKALIAALVLSMLCGCNETSTEPADAGVDAGTGGEGGSGPCPTGQVPSQQVVPTEFPCDLSGPAAQCAQICEVHCDEAGFDLGMSGSACARTADASERCRCVCVECRPG